MSRPYGVAVMIKVNKVGEMRMQGPIAVLNKLLSNGWKESLAQWLECQHRSLTYYGISFSASGNHPRSQSLTGSRAQGPRLRSLTACYQPSVGPGHRALQLPLLVSVPPESGPSLKGSLLALSMGPVNTIASLRGGGAAEGKNPKANAPQKCHQ